MSTIVYQAWLDPNASLIDVKVYQAYLDPNASSYNVKVYQAWLELTTANQGPSRAHKEEKKKSYRDIPIDWVVTLKQNIEDKKTEIKEIKKRVAILQKHKKVLSKENEYFYDRELSELTELLQILEEELQKLLETKTEIKKFSHREKVNLFSEVDEFEDLFFILKFVLKRL